jgi:hypothetical protein
MGNGWKRADLQDLNRTAVARATIAMRAPLSTCLIFRQDLPKKEAN